MKSSEVVLGLAARLWSWRAVLVFVQTRATCKPWPRDGLHPSSTFLAAAAGASATASENGAQRRPKRRYADVDGPGAAPALDLGPHGPTLKKLVVNGVAIRKPLLELLPADLESIWGEFEREWEPTQVGRDKWVSWRSQTTLPPLYATGTRHGFPHQGEAMDPQLSPSAIRKGADASRPSASASGGPGSGPRWWSFLCLGSKE